MVVIVTGYTMFVMSQSDVIFTFANQRFDEVCWHNLHIQGRRSSSRAGRAIKMLREMETYKINCYQLCLFLFITNVDLKNNTENHSELSGCANSCNKFISGRSWWTMKLPMILLWKGTSAPVAPLFKEQRGNAPAMPPFSGVPVHIILYQKSPTWCPLRGHQVARKEHADRPRACSNNNISVINVFTLMNINTKINESKLSKIFISEVCIKLVALRTHMYTRSSWQFQKGWWSLFYTQSLYTL